MIMNLIKIFLITTNIFVFGNYFNISLETNIIVNTDTNTNTDTQCPNISNRTNHDNREDKNKLRLVQYNVEWMFYDYYSNSNCPGSGCEWKSQSEVLEHMDYISNIINELNPSIINFCEIEGCDELEMIKNRTNLQFSSYLIKGTDTSTGQNVGMLTLIDPIINLYRTESRYDYPIVNSKCGYTVQGNIGVSKHYMTKFNISNIPIAMISAHLLAYPTDPYRCSAREAQAMVLQEQIVNLVLEGYQIILLGDFNDFDNLIPDTNFNYPKSKVLDILKGLEGINAGKYELKSIGDKITQSQRYSDYWDSNSNCDVEPNEFSMIDHILLSPLLYNYVSNVFGYHKYSHDCVDDKYNSDHDPIVVDFDFGYPYDYIL